jgi:hypothetical protein
MDSYDGASEMMAVFAGAGDGPFVDKLVERVWEDVQIASCFDEACIEAEKSIKMTYKEYGQVFQPGYCPYAELLYGIKMDGQSKLFRADGAIVNEKVGYAVGGTGRYLSEFLCSRMYGQSLSLSQAVVLSSYVLRQAIEHLDGCGGDQHIAVLRNEGGSEVVDPNTLREIVNHLKSIDKEASNVLFATVNLDLSEDSYKGLVEHLRILLAAARDRHRTQISDWLVVKRLVLENEKQKRAAQESIPSNSQTSEDQP